MKTIFSILMLLGVLTAGAADRITATIAVTNAPIGNTNTLTINANVRTFTNTVTGSPGTLIQETNSIPWSATNILNQLTDYRISQFHFLGQSQSTNVTVVGAVGEALTVTLAGGWGFVTYSTQTVSSPTFIVRVPLTVEQTSNRTHIASLLVQGQSDNSTNSFATNAVAMTNYLTRGASPQQYVVGPMQFNGTLRGASQVALTNGFTSAVTNINSVSSNHINYGNAIRSEGSGGNSLQVGSNAVASGPLSLAIGNGSIASSNSATAIGVGAVSTNGGGIALGTSARTTGASATALGESAVAGASAVSVGNAATADGGSIAIGQDATSLSVLQGTAVGNNSQVTANYGVALGYLANSGHSNSVAMGANSATTTTNQIRLGTASETVSVPGVLEVSGTQTNTIFSGTNKFQLAVSFTATNITSLANGANDVDPGFKTYLRVSGPTAAYSIDKIDRGYDGRILIIQKTDSYTMTVINSSGAGVLGDEAKILTGTGGTLTITNNPGFVQLIYDATASRWGVINKSN